MIKNIGELVDKREKAASLVEEIQSKFSLLDNLTHNEIPAAYLIWRNPYMAAGGDTFIHDMMQRCGFKNI